MLGTMLRVISAAGLLAFAIPAAAAERPIVVELFTAQGCSSCPPADELLNDFARTRPDLLPLSFHVDYWNRLGWNDPFSSPEATERQRVYASRATDPTLFTPEMVVDGTTSVIGSDANQVDEALDAAADAAVTLAPVTLAATPGGVVITVGAGTGRADIVLIGFDRSRTTAVRRGENVGRTLTESNIVRSIDTVGSWTGSALTLTQKRPAGQAMAVLLTAPDGRIVGAATAR